MVVEVAKLAMMVKVVAKVVKVVAKVVKVAKVAMLENSEGLPCSGRCSPTARKRLTCSWQRRVST